MNEIHKKFLLKAHALAKNNFGKTFPNPTVGCVIVKKNKIISTGVTSQAGRPHAEEIALKKAGKETIDSTMYVTLEPCNHKSYNGSCANQIIRSGIKKIYIAKSDPDFRTNKKSIRKFKENNIYVNLGITEKKTYELNKFFFDSLNKKIPYTKVKMAISVDEKIAWPDYSSKWISNTNSRKYAHLLRFQSQAILTTSKTIIKDNPRFTVRKNNKIIKYIPLIIIDNNLKIPIDSKIFKNLSKRRILIFTSKKNKKSKFLKELGCELIYINNDNKSQMNLKKIFKKIYLFGIKDILVEAGGIFFTKIIKQKLVNEIHIFKANFKIGDNGIPLLLGKSIKDLNLTNVYSKKFINDKYYNYLINQ